MMDHAYALEIVIVMASLVTLGLVFRAWREVERAYGWASATPDAADVLLLTRWKCRMYGWFLFIAILLTLGALAGVFLEPPDQSGQFWSWVQFTPARLTVLAVNVSLGMAFLSEHVLRQEMRAPR